jgi:hypothetical protein
VNAFGEGGGVMVIGSILMEENYAYFDMFNGTISGNNAVFGGGVANIDFGLFDMINGEISGNTVALFGGGVANFEFSLFIKREGKISGNIAAHGGGVSNYDDGMFVMQGGQIAGNSATLYGGGIDNFDGTFLISSGIIYGQNALSDLANSVNLSNGGAALYSDVFMSTSSRGTFGPDGFERLGDLMTTEHTLHVVNGLIPGAVSSITITDIPAKYLGRGGDVDFMAFNDEIEFLSLGSMMPINSSMFFTPGLAMDSGTWTLVLEFFFPPWVINQVPEAIYEIELYIPEGIITISYNDSRWVQVHPAALTRNMAPGRLTPIESLRLPGSRLPPEERILRDRAPVQRDRLDRQLLQRQPRSRQTQR